MKNKRQTKAKLKELVKPKDVDANLSHRVESLCGELRDIQCPSLRRYSGTDTEEEEDILF